MVQFLKKRFNKERKGHVDFLYELRHRKEPLVLKILKFEIYFTFLLPTRILILIPDVLFVFLVVVWYIYFSSVPVISYLCCFIFWVLLENCVIHVIYHYTTSGSVFIDDFLYGKQNTVFFLGNTSTVGLRKFAMGVGALLVVKGALTANEVVEQTAHAYQVADIHEKSIKAVQQIAAARKEATGVNMAPEEWDMLLQEYQKKLTLKGINAEADVTVLPDGIKVAGEVGNSSKSLSGSVAVSGLSKK